MINSNKIEEWIHEVEERSSSAPNIIRYIANRLAELTSRNEELLVENIELRSGHKVEEYESRITNLEYQVELLKRQLGGRTPLTDFTDEKASAQARSLILFNSLGEILRWELDLASLEQGQVLGGLNQALNDEDVPGLLGTAVQEELLYVYDSGRTVTQPVNAIPLALNERTGWDEAYHQEPRSGESLVALLPVARMSLFDFAVQVSRRGFVKKIRQDFFVKTIASGFIGAGVKQAADKTCCLALCHKEDQLVLVTWEGFTVTIPIEKLPLTIEEVLRLSPTDHIATAFTTSNKPSLLVITNNGKVIHRDVSWLEQAVSFKSHGQSLYSKERREAGVRVAGAALVDEKDWGAALSSDGQIAVCQMSDLFSSGSFLPANSRTELLNFTTL